MARPFVGFLAGAVVVAVVLGPLSSVVHGQTKKEQAEYLAAPPPDSITAEFLAPAARQAVANGVAAIVARMMAEGNDHGLAFPPTQTVKLIEMIDVPAKRVQVAHPVWEHEYAEIERIVPVMESGQPTGRFTKQKERVVVKSKQVDKRIVEQLVPDKDGSETMKLPKYGPGGPAAWPLNLPGFNGMALYVLAKAGLAHHPATVKHAAALAEHASESMGLPDGTFDVAWMAAGFAALGPDSAHESVARRLIGKLIDGQVREKGDLDGLWGPVCVNYGYYGRLMTLGQTLRQELDVTLPKKIEAATPSAQEKLVALAKEMKAVANAYERTHRDVFRAGTRMLEIQKPYPFEGRAILPGLPFNAYQWVVTDVESTEAAAFALAVAKKADLLPRETDRLAIRGKKIHPPVKTETVVKAAAKRMAAAIDDDGGTKAMALVAANTGYDKTGFPAPSFAGSDSMPSFFDIETACTTVAALETVESLVAVDAAVDNQLAEPRKRARDRAARIAERWYKESANPASEAWKGMYVARKVSFADLKKSGVLEVPAASGTEVEALPWGPAGCLYRIVPGFRGLFAEADGKDRFGNDLFRQIAYRLVALQDQSGQWSSVGSSLLTTANESLAMGRMANAWHKSLNRDPPLKLPVADPVSCEMLIHLAWDAWGNHRAVRPDAAVFPTLASLVFLVEAIDRPVSLDGIAILPEPTNESAKEAEAGAPPPRLTPVDAARRVVRPNVPRQELFDAIVTTRWPRKTAATPLPAPPAKPEKKEAVAKEKEDEEDDDSLGKFEDLLEPSDAKE